ncbi:MAG: endonuclease [Synergistaceae bacterium]|nr:endonuclease [Synergistaceae bacterium]
MAMDSGQMGIHAREKYLALGLDPGRSKTGFAFVNMNGDLLVSGIFQTSEKEIFFSKIESSINELPPVWIKEATSESLSEISGGQLKILFIGNGTGSKEFISSISERAVRNHYEIFSVDESNTTLFARKLYWKIHKPKFFTRLIPEGLRVPPRMLDDLAAWAVALRGLKEYRDISRNRL